ncbi:MAG: hypothetical protein ACPLEW_07185 [Pseudothermotoga sp.]|jgi:hypothetical protein
MENSGRHRREKVRICSEKGTYEELTHFGTKVRGHIPEPDSPFRGIFEGNAKTVLETWLATFRVANKIPIDGKTTSELAEYFLSLVEENFGIKTILLYAMPE